MKEILFILICVLISYTLIYDKPSKFVYIIIAFVTCVIFFDILCYKKKSVEKYTENKFIDESFIESFPYIEDMKLYLSCFQKDKINFDTSSLQNHLIDDDIAAIQVDIDNIADNYSQRDGFFVFSEIKLPTPKEIINLNTFSIFFYMKFVRSEHNIKNKRLTKFTLFQFHHNNIEPASNFVFFEIILEFGLSNLNPTIKIKFLNQEKDDLTYTYNPEEYYKDTIFNDNNFHLFTFTKSESEIHFYIDNIKVIECKNEKCFDISDIKTVNNKEIKLRDDMNCTINSGLNKLRFNLCSFGIYTKCIDFEDIKKLGEYFKNVRKEFSVDHLEKNGIIQNLRDSLYHYEKDCPFSDSTICSNRECYDVGNWNNMDNIISNKNCFRKVNSYCNSLSNITTEDTLCTFVNDTNIYKMASTLDSNLFYYDKNNIEGNIVQEQLLEQLKKLGLKDIYMDKSFRTGYENNGEMNRIINDLLKTNQTVNVDTVDALYTDPTSRTYANDTNILLDDSNTSIEKLYSTVLNNSNLHTSTQDISDINQTNTQTNSDLIDIKYDEIDKPHVYDNIIKNYNVDKIQKENSSLLSWNIFDYFL
jgi:Ca2+/Na+ antiporter